MRGTALIVAIVIVTSTIGGIAAGTHHPAVAEPGSADVAAAQTADSYVVEQGSFCEPIEPLSSGETVEEFYDYRNHETHPPSVDRLYSSYGTTHLQEDDTSQLFLHEGPNGTSLVVVNDRLDGNTGGGAATFEFVGLPREAEWVVQDDDYSGATATFDAGDGWASASWIWTQHRTDGGAIRGGLDGQFAVTIHPAFNDDAEFDPADDDTVVGGDITDWDVLSGSAENPDRTSLPSLEEPVTIRSGTCDDPSITYDQTDDGLTATVGDGDDGDQVFLRPSSGPDDGVRFEQVGVTTEGEPFSVTFADRHTESAPDDAETLSSLTVTGDGTPEETETTIVFSVEKDRLEESGVEPEDLALYERAGDEWRQVPTSVHDESNESYQFVAEGSTVSSLAVAEQRQNLESSGGTGGSSTGGEDDPESMRGFGIVGSVGALLAIVWLWTTRRSSE
ncbi:PGF-pre-PGF domain-containing protein [Natribaculum luteum]|uniref:PGF-pre-PGF domain-containing protein n=1 Tax=Natribaculum luteum TaxID=1586232 RepID=A0ABD5P0R2_9EURY|nr:PGF-pre-PGF domain-containing protein [Natribaculum luteum]